MKILNCGDLHIGVKKDDPWMQNIQRLSILSMIEYSKENDITVWIQYGDVFDNRQALTHNTISFAKQMFGLIEEAGITVHIIVGNHDIPKKDTLLNHAVGLELGHFSNLKIYDEPTAVDFDGVYIDLIPWLCKSNVKSILDYVKSSHSEYCIGHWELSGFYYYKGLPSHGLEPDFLKKYKQVWSGHFHCISEAANVKYIGTPYTITAGDENDSRGIWVFDTSTRKMEFVENDTCWHRKIYYPDPSIKASDFKNIAVRVIADKIDDGLTKLESELEEVVHSLQIITKIDNSVDDVDEEAATITLSKLGENYIDAMPEMTDADKKSIKSIFNKLYVEAHNQ